MHDGDSESAESRTPMWWKTRRGKRPRSIRQRVLRVALVPSVGLIVLWLILAGYLGYQGFFFHADATGVQNMAIPGIDGFASLQKERQLSMVELANPNASDHSALKRQRTISDQNLAAMEQGVKTEVVFRLAPPSIKNRVNTLVGYVHKLPTIRAQVDSGAIDPQKVYAFYNKVLTSATAVFYSVSRGAPATESVQVGLTSTDVFRASDLMSRAGSEATAGFATGKFSSKDYLAFANLVGAYHSALSAVQPDLQPGAKAALRNVMRGQEWKELGNAENALLSHGAWTHGVPRGLPVDAASWTRLADTVSNQLIKVTQEQANEMAVLYENAANTQVAYAVGGTILAAAVVAFAIFWALRQSNVLVGRTLVPRIRQLGTEANAVVRVHLPAILQRLAEGEQVDARSAVPQLSYRGDEDDPRRAEAERGEDEIDRVAQVLNQAMVVAVEAAIRESEARAGAQKVFLGIAYRNQKPLQQVLTQLDAWEQTEPDADRLDQWFKIHYLITQVRGVTESLIILGGGQPGRRWQSPVLLRDVLRSAISQANQYPRIRLEMAPEAHLSGGAVAGTIHLVTQLLNNAVEFSSPESPVKVRSFRVDTGAVVEVEDQGVGMRSEERDRINTMLRDAPDFNVTALKDGSQLGFWVVAHLARRLNIRVELRASPYGGVLAIALLPASLLAGDRAIEASRPRAIPERQQSSPEVSGSYDGQTQSVPTRGAEPRNYSTPNGHDAPEAPSAPEPVGATSNWPPNPPMSGRHSQPADGHQLPPRIAPEPVGTRQPASLDNWPVSAPPASRRPSPRAAEPQPAGSPFDRPALPERRPQQHLAPQLRDEVPAADVGQEIDMGSPDDIRARLSAFQQGTRAGRAGE
jgi:signal transduction histidine kinase